MEERILFLLKFGSQKNIMDLYENGTLYLSPFEQFQVSEKNNYRGDRKEGTIFLENYPDPSIYRIEITDTYTGKTFLHTSKSLSKEYKDLSAGNLYSMYCIKNTELAEGQKYRVSEKMKEFGSHFLFIHNPQEFKRRVEKAFKELDLTYRAGVVKYYNDKNYSGPLSLFHKKIEQEYQKEFRIVTRNSKSEPIILKLKNLENISIIMETKRLEHLEFSITEAEKKTIHNTIS